jgi:hypothetical protein
LDDRASNVLNDPVEELIDLLVFAERSSSGSRRVCFWYEPSGTAMDVHPCGRDRLLVTLSEAVNFTPPMTGRPAQEVWRGLLTRRTIASALRDALQAWTSDHEEKIRSDWYKSKRTDVDLFGLHEARLRRALGRRSGTQRPNMRAQRPATYHPLLLTKPGLFSRRESLAELLALARLAIQRGRASQ